MDPAASASATAPAAVHVDHAQHAQDAIFNGPVHLPRGRQARDPEAKTVPYTVASLDQFESCLREYLDNPPEPPEHSDCMLSFWIGATFAVSASQLHPHPQQHQHQQQTSRVPSQPHLSQNVDAPPAYQAADSLPQYGAPSHPYQNVSDPAIALTLPTFPSQPSAPSAPPASGAANPSNDAKKPEEKVILSIVEALQSTPDPKDKMRKQRAIAKCCVDAIQRQDGFRYSFHNCWNSREDDSFRFSYYCNDSLLNKDRAANGKGAKLGKRATKPVYDCKGVLSVKFSATKQALDVFYKHIPIHKTYEERAPPPRKDSKRRKYLEENDPEALSRIQSRPRPEKDANPALPPKPKKKKKKHDETKTPTSLESDLRAQSLRSLLELIRPEPDPEPVPPQQHQPRRPPPPPPPQPASEPSPVPPLQVRMHMQQRQKRSRNSCDVCKLKKTKCDGTRPVCKTCTDKKRQCVYTDMGDDRPPATPLRADSAPQVQAANSELSELEKMKKELEEAKARIQELEEEKRRASITPSQTPQMPSAARPHSRSQSDPKSQPAPQQTRPHPQPQRQMQPVQHLQTAQLQSPQQMQPSQQLQGTQQMAAPQQLQSPQQMQTSQYNQFTNHNTHTFAINRSMSAQNMAQTASQSQTPQQGMPHGTGLTPTADAHNPYRPDFTWPPAYYGYQSPQPPQQDQWAAARNPGVFR